MWKCVKCSLQIRSPGCLGEQELFFLLYVFFSPSIPSFPPTLLPFLPSFFHFTHTPAPPLIISLFTARWVVFTVLWNLSGDAFCSSSVSSPFQKAISRRSMWITQCAGRGCSPNCAEQNGCCQFLQADSSDTRVQPRSCKQRCPELASQQEREKKGAQVTASEH